MFDSHRGKPQFLSKEMNKFFRSKVKGRERIFLFIVLPLLLLLTAVCVYVVAFSKPQQSTGETAAIVAPVESKHLPPLEAAVLIENLKTAHSLEESGELARAEQAFLAITETNPENDRALGGLGRTRVALGSFKEAIPPLDRACRLDINGAGYYASRGIAKRGLKDLKGAYQDLNDAVRLDPRNVLTANRLLFVIIEREDYPQYERTLEKIKGAGHTSSTNHWILPSAYKEFLIGDVKQGKSLLREAKEALPPEQYQTLVKDPVFASKRGKEFLETLNEKPEEEPSPTPASP